jgi:tetratricopeptide (TPR) repeat protein
MNSSIFIPTASFRESLNLNDLTNETLKTKYSFEQRQNYQAIKNWLSGRYQVRSLKTIDRLKCYLQSFEHLIAIDDWQRALQILIEPIGEYSDIEEQDVLGQLQVWGYDREAIELCEKIVERIEPIYQLLIISRLANAYEKLHEYQQAIDLYQTTLNLATELGQLRIGAQSISNIGNIHLLQRDYLKAIKFYQEAWKIAEQIDDDRLKLTILGNNGNVFISIGDYANAMPWLEKALVIVRKIGDRYAEGITYGELGIATSCLGRHQQAQDYLLASLGIALELEDRQGELSVLANLGNNYDYQKNYLKAIEYHQKTLQLARDLQNSLTEANTLSGLGNSYYFLGDYAQAQTYFEQSKELADRIDYPLGSAIALANLGTNLGKLDRPDVAISHLMEAFDQFKQLQSIDLAATAAHRLAEIYHQTHQNDFAQIYLQFALGIAKELSLPLLNNCEELDLRIKQDLSSNRSNLGIDPKSNQ